MEYVFIDGKYTIVEINDKYRLYWAYDSSNEMFSFTVVVQTLGWIAFGVSTRRGGMIGYDVMVGGVDSSGNGYIAVRNLVIVVINLVLRVFYLTAGETLGTRLSHNNFSWTILSKGEMRSS